MKNSYVASQKFSGEWQAAKEQVETGLHSRITYRAGVISIAVMGNSGAGQILKDGSLWIGRPASEHLDRTVAAACGQNGVCTVNLNLAEGAWMLKISGSVSGQPYRRDARMWIAGDGSARVE